MRRRMDEAVRNKGLDVIYDAQCRFCLRSLRLLEWLAGDRLFRLHDGNDRELVQAKFSVLARADTNDAMYVVTPRGEVFRGFFAYRRIMWESPRLYPLLPLFYAPGAGLIGPLIYAWVARHRRHFGCSLDGVAQCSVASDRVGRLDWAKGIAGALGALLLAATLAPVAQNWSPAPRDNFPFS